jgi:hypothetical protein
MTTTDISQDIQRTEDLATEDRTHYVTPFDNPSIWRELGGGMDVSGHDIVVYGRLNFKEITAVCGHKFVPILDPDKYPACESCVAEATSRMQERGE